MISYAQNFEDVRLARVFRDVRHGFYVDIGAMLPIEDSVTKYFYDLGWDGVNVEPVESYWRELAADRPRDTNLRIAITDGGGEAVLHHVPGTGLSSLQVDALQAAANLGVQPEDLRVPTMTLASLCEQYAARPIDFLKVDVEGAEAAVLRSGDWQRFRPTIVIVEAVKPNTRIPSHAEWESTLIGNGYVLAVFDGVNRFYVEQGAQELIEPLAMSPNVLDNFERWHTHYLQGALQDARDQLREVETSLADSEAERSVVLQRIQEQRRDLDRIWAERRHLVRYLNRADAQLGRMRSRVEAVTQLRVYQLARRLGGRRWPQLDLSPVIAEADTLHHDLAAFNAVRGATRSQRVWLDVSLTAQHGLRTPIGLVRVEHYVAAFLAADPSIDLHFVVFDRRQSRYRGLREAEHALLSRIIDGVDSATDVPSGLTRALDDTRRPQPAHVADRVALLARRSGLSGLQRALARLAAPDVACGDGAGPIEQAADDAAPPADENGPRPGDVLICVGDLWDYMDYAYLHRLCRGGGVRLVSIVYDVIPMQLPYTSAWPPHIYHRHCIELGHLAWALVAISQHSADSYQRLISAPNDLSVPVTYAHLPNFLKERADQIGELPVGDLAGRPFVVYCSTLEIRKNHQLLLHIWDRLREDVGPDRLPLLIFVGAWGWGTEKVRLLVERNWRLRGHVRVLLQVSDAELTWLYRNARFSVFPSYAEGFGLGAAESLSFGTPVIVSDCPALLEATEDLMPAYSPYDFRSWYDELRQLVVDDVRLEQLRAAAQQFRGPGYDTFARAVREAARAVAV